MKNKDPRYPNLHGHGLIELESATLSGTWVSDSASEGSYITYMNATNNDSTTASQIMAIEITDGSDNVVAKLGNFAMTAEAGTKSDASVAPDDIKGSIACLDVDGASNKQLFIPAGYKIKATVSPSINGTDKVWLSIGYAEMAED